MHLCVRSIDFISFGEFSIRIWNCSDGVVWFFFSSFYLYVYLIEQFVSNFKQVDGSEQGRLNRIICPLSMMCTGAPTVTTTHRNKNVNGR